VVSTHSRQAFALALIAASLLNACSNYGKAEVDRPENGDLDTGRALGTPEALPQMPSSDQLLRYKVSAYAGSGSAANSLALFYSKAAPEGNAELYWTMVGAENGDAVAQFNLATLYLEEGTGHHSLQRAVYWLEKSAASNHIYAKKLLEELAERQRQKKE